MRWQYILFIFLLLVSGAVFWSLNNTAENVRQEMFSIFDSCDDADNRFDCYDKQVSDLSDKYSTAFILKTLENEKNNQEVNDCHIFTHSIGHKVYNDSESFLESFSGCTEYCFGGCLHGIAEEHFSNILESGGQVNKETFSEINQMYGLCSSSVGDDVCWKNLGESLHGIGHALMFISGNDVLESLSGCNDISPGEDAEACYGGVFMSNSEAFLEVGGDIEFAKINDPIFPCDTIDVLYQKMCYKNAAEYRLTGNAEENIKICNKFPENEKNYCFEQVSRKNIVNIKDLGEVAEVCSSINSEYQKYCVRGTWNYFMDKYGIEKSEEFCSKLPAELIQFCTSK